MTLGRYLPAAARTASAGMLIRRTQNIESGRQTEVAARPDPHTR